MTLPRFSGSVDEAGVVSAGQPPTGDLAAYISIEDARAGFTVHAALPRADALAEWRRSSWLRAGALFLVSLGFLILSRILVRALRQRSHAEQDTAAAHERVSQLASYKVQLENTLGERTGELNGVNKHPEAELIERKVAENACANTTLSSTS